MYSLHLLCASLAACARDSFQLASPVLTREEIMETLIGQIVFFMSLNPSPSKDSWYSLYPPSPPYTPLYISSNALIPTWNDVYVYIMHSNSGRREKTNATSLQLPFHGSGACRTVEGSFELVSQAAGGRPTAQRASVRLAHRRTRQVQEAADCRSFFLISRLAFSFCWRRDSFYIKKFEPEIKAIRALRGCIQNGMVL